MPNDPWWIARFKEHPFQTTSIGMLTVGGSFMLVFFLKLGELPDLNLASMTAILAAVAVLGLAFCALLGGSVLPSGVVTRNLVDSEPYLRSGWTIAAISAPGLLIIGVVVVVFSAWPIQEIPGWLLLSLSCALCAITAGARTRWILKENRTQPAEAEVANSAWSRWWAVFPIVFICAQFFTLIAPMAFLVMYALYPRRETQGLMFWLSLFFWVLFCYAINIAAIFAPKTSQYRRLVGLAMFSLIGLIVVTKNVEGIPMAAVRALGLGDVSVGVVLSKEGCETLNKAARGQIVCKVASNDSSGWACPVLLASKVGSPFFLQLAAFDDRDGA